MLLRSRCFSIKVTSWVSALSAPRWWVSEISERVIFPSLHAGEGLLHSSQHGKASRGSEKRREERQTCADFCHASPHESWMWKLTPVLSLHFLRKPVVCVFIWMTVNFSLCLLDVKVCLCMWGGVLVQNSVGKECKRVLHQINREDRADSKHSWKHTKNVKNAL